MGERRTSPGITTWSLMNTLDGLAVAGAEPATERAALPPGRRPGARPLRPDRLERGPPVEAVAHLHRARSSTPASSSTRAPPSTWSPASTSSCPSASTTRSPRSPAPTSTRGISALVNATGGLENRYDGTNIWSGTFNATTTVTPNPWVSFTLGWLSNLSFLQAVDEPVVNTSSGRVDGERDDPAHQRDLGDRHRHPDRLRWPFHHLRHRAAQLLPAPRRPPAQRLVLEDLRHRRPVHASSSSRPACAGTSARASSSPGATRSSTRSRR